ncbi:MAG: calcium-binding protein [Hydrococcus sp. RU_2_2]|nr:calcium-binding protein [Hydrococcus sp. RU_2_2]
MGTINLNAGDLTLRDTGLRVRDGAKISTENPNDGGHITIDTGNLIIGAPGVIIASPGTGNYGGNITIDPGNPIVIDAPGGIIIEPPNDSPGTGNDGAGGTISINTEGDFIIARANILGTAENDRLVGSPAKDVIIALAGNDTLFGLADNDSLFGGLGNDLLYGGLGEDDLFGGAGNDTLLGLASEDDLFGGAGNDILNGGLGDDDLFGESGNDRMAGSDGNDDLFGGPGNDILVGGTGNDELFSGRGRDTLVGGAGQDEFIFLRTTGGDRIQDFVPTQDEIELDRVTFGLNSLIGDGFSVQGEFAIVNTNLAAANSVARIVYNQASGALFYNANQSVAGFGQTGELLAILTGAPRLSRGDFEIISGISEILA